MANNWTALTGLPGGLSPDTMLLLTDASVLVHDANSGNNWYRLTPDGVGKYETGAWSGPFTTASTRQFFASGVLNDGRAFALGGEYSSAGKNTPLGEIFDPQTNAWSTLAKPPAFNWINGDVAGCILADGRVLFGALSSSRTAIWNPALGTAPNAWTEAGLAFQTLASPTKVGTTDEETWTLLADGTVLTVDISSPSFAEKYDPATDTWIPADQTPATLTQQLALISLVDTTATPPAVINIGEIGPAILLPDGQVFAVGATGHTALYTPPAIPSNPGSWSAGPDFPTDLSSNNFNSVNGNLQTAIDAPAVLLPCGKVLCVAGDTALQFGGTQFWSTPIRIYIYDPFSNTMPLLVPQPTVGTGADTFTARFLLLPTGQVLFSAGQAFSTMSIFTVDPALLGVPNPAWKPVITAVPPIMAVGHHYLLSGLQITGLSHANSYGDDAQMATNFPLVQLTDSGTGAVVYARTHGFSTRGVATGTNVENTIFDVPGSLPTGTYDLRVIANGIPADPFTVSIVPLLPAIAVDPHHDLSFGTVCAGPVYRQLEVFNVGAADLIVDSVSRLSGSSDFTVLPNPATPLTIAAGDQVDFTIVFDPTTNGVPELATIRIVSNDPVTPNFDLTATGTGGTGHLETIIADGGALGSVCLGSFVDRTLTLNNNGPCVLTILGLTSTSAQFELPSVAFYPLKLAPGVSIEMPIRFAPTASGTQLATITISSDDPGGPKDVSVSGIGLVPSLTVMVPNSGGFGRVCRGAFADMWLTLNNHGHCTLDITGITSSMSDFMAPTVQPYPLTINGGTSLQVPIRFHPESHGPRSAVITILSNDPAGPKEITLSGMVPWGKLAVTGSTYFGEVPCGFVEKTVSICNVGHCELHVERVAFRRPRKHFKLINNPFPATLHPGSCLAVVIRYWAHCDEPESCELVIHSDDPERPVHGVDVVAYTRCSERCRCKTKSHGCSHGCDDDKRSRGCDDDRCSHGCDEDKRSRGCDDDDKRPCKCDDDRRSRGCDDDKYTPRHDRDRE
jgi:hypothetical protein